MITTVTEQIQINKNLRTLLVTKDNTIRLLEQRIVELQAELAQVRQEVTR